MARPILVYGQPASGKSFAFKTLDPDKTIILDVDNKGALPWRGFKKDYSADKKNFFSLDTLDKIYNSIKKIAADNSYNHISVIGVDGFNNALINEQTFYDEWHNAKNPYEKFTELAKKTKRIIKLAQNMRDDLTVIFTAHVEVADSYSPGDVDHLFTPGKQLKDKFRIESSFLYVFYAKIDADGNHFFETCPVNSTARSPEHCFPAQIPNDLQLVLDTINHYEIGDD